MSEIIININEANKAQKYQNENELFQIEAFKNVAKILQEHKVGKDTSDITDCRFHDTIFIDGDRGVGKTAFMINIQHYYDVIDCKNNNNCVYAKDTKRPKYIFLKPVDPTLLEHTEKFLSVVLARIVEYVNDNKQDTKKGFEEKYYKSLENLSKSLEAIKTLDKDIGIEEIASNKSSLKLEQYAHEFFHIVCMMFGVNAIVMLIDDVDMAFDKGFDVLEVVRKYLASPYLIPIVAGDMKLYREIVETKFMDKIEFLKDIEHLDKIHLDSKALRESDIYKDKIQLIDHLVEQYLRKIFPSEYQIQLKDINTIKKEYKITVVLPNNISESLNDIENFELKHINMGINQEEFYFPIFSDNTRDFIQYLFNKKDIYKEYFGNIEKYILTKNTMDLYKNSFLKTAEFYKFSHDRKKKELSILANNDYQSFDGNSYNLYKAFISNLFSSMKKFQDVEKSVDKYSIKAEGLQKILNEDDGYKDISNYIIDLFIFNDYYSSYQRRNYIYSGKFLESMIYSFSFHRIPNLVDKELTDEVNSTINNFSKDISESVNFFQNIDVFHTLNDEIYSILYDQNSKHTQNKVLSDKFNNLLLGTNDNSIQERNKILKWIANQIPFGSEFLTNNRYKNERFEDADADEINESENKYDLIELSRAISIWRNVFLKNIELNSLSLYEIVYKFFKNIEKIKIEEKYVVIEVNKGRQQKIAEFDELQENNPIVYLQRIVLMFINSIAFFESNSEKVANINIATGKTFNLENILSKTPASSLNIKPMFEKEDSLTRALFFHPIISHILFPQDNSKLKKLEFVGQKSKNDVSKIIIFPPENIDRTPEEILMANGYKSGIGLAKRISVMKSIVKNLGTYNNNEIHKLKNSIGFINLLSKKYDDEKYKSIQLEFKSLFGL